MTRRRSSDGLRTRDPSAQLQFFLPMPHRPRGTYGMQYLQRRVHLLYCLCVCWQRLSTAAVFPPMIFVDRRSPASFCLHWSHCHPDYQQTCPKQNLWAYAVMNARGLLALAERSIASGAGEATLAGSAPAEAVKPLKIEPACQRELQCSNVTRIIFDKCLLLEEFFTLTSFIANLTRT